MFDDCPALALFRLFEVQMCHAWTVDPQEQETYRVVVKEEGSYDALYSAIIEAQDLNPNVSGLSPDQKAEYERKVYEGMSPDPPELMRTHSKKNSSGLHRVSKIYRISNNSPRANKFSRVFAARIFLCPVSQ